MFDTQDRLDDMLDKITSMMSKFTAQDSNQNRPFKPKIYQEKGEDKLEIIIIKIGIKVGISNSGNRRMSYRGRAQYRQKYRGRLQHDQIYRNFRKENFRRMQNYRDQNFRGRYRGNIRNDNFGRGRCRSRERQYSGNFRRSDRSSSRSKSGSRVSINRDGIRCFKCWEYDHFAKDCLNISDTEEEQSEQIQQMLNLEEDKTTLKVIVADTYKNLIKANSEETIDHLNL